MSDPVYNSMGGEPLTPDDYRALEARWITRDYATLAGLFRVDCQVGANLIGRNGKLNYAGMAIPYHWPGCDNVREYLLRRDEPDYERRSDNSLRAIKKYLAPLGRKNLLYFPPGTDPTWLDDVSLPVIFVEGAFKAIALARYFAERGEKVLVVAVSGVWNWRGVIEKATDANGKRVDVKGPIPDLDRIEWCGRSVTILFDRNVNDNDSVRAARAMFAAELRGRGAKISFVDLPGDFQGNGVDDFLAERGPDALTELFATRRALATSFDTAVTLNDFRAHSPDHRYIFTPTGDIWTATSVNSRILPIATGRTKANGDDEYISASKWLDQNRAVEQLTWAPGEPQLIRGKLINKSGWIERPQATVFNVYHPPTIALGDPILAERWLKHLRQIYPSDWKHIAQYLAHKVQFPGVKINHALLLGGDQGIGKDTIIEPAKYAVGPWNCSEVTPINLLGRFNEFIKSVLLRISEARDMGDFDRYAFYDHIKVYTAAPPEFLLCDEKNTKEYYVPNVCGVIITTNHKTDGIYLPANDRRHYVAWSEVDPKKFSKKYWTEFYRWYEDGGYSHVAAYLTTLDVSKFNPKAAPPKTPAFWAIVDANRAPEDNELADVLDSLEYPDAVTLDDLARMAADLGMVSFRDWLIDRRNRRQIPGRLESAGYVQVRNPTAKKDGQWVINGRRKAVYVKLALSLRDQISAAEKLKGLV